MSERVAYLFGKGPGLDRVDWSALLPDVPRLAINHAIAVVPGVDYGFATDGCGYLRQRWPRGCMAVVPMRCAGQVIADNARAVLGYVPVYPRDAQCWLDQRSLQLCEYHSTAVTALHFAVKWLGVKRLMLAGIHDGAGFAECLGPVLCGDTPSAQESYDAGWAALRRWAQEWGVELEIMHVSA